MTASVTGGTILLTQNGNRWIGAGHHSIFTDSQGRDWISYHAIDRFDPWLNEPGGINRRPMLIDWIDGWPSVRGGAGPSEGAQPAPAVESLLSATAWAPADGFENMSAATDPQGGDVGRVSGLSVSREDLPQGNIRVAFDVLLGEESFRAEIGSGLSVRLDPETASFTVTAPGVDEQVGLRATDGWRRVVVTVRGGNIEAEVSEGGLKAPSSWISVAAPGLDRDAEPLRLEGNALVDNLWVQNPAVGLSEHVAVPEPGEELWRDGFADQLDERWSWVREQDDVTVDDGLHWPLRDADLVGDNNSAAVLLTDPGSDDDWIIETEFTLDLGEDDIRNHQQAGLIAYRNDEDFARLSSVAIWRTRTVEYGREVAVRPGDDRTIYGGAIIGASAPTMRMRLAYHQNDAGEHLYRAGISTDTGQSWIWGAVWTFSAGEQPRVGLYTGGGTHHDAVASFHYVSKSEATWPTGDGSLPAPSPSPSEPPSQSPSESPEPTESPVPRPSTPGKRPGLPEAGS